MSALQFENIALSVFLSTANDTELLQLRLQWDFQGRLCSSTSMMHLGIACPGASGRRGLPPTPPEEYLEFSEGSKTSKQREQKLRQRSKTTSRQPRHHWCWVCYYHWLCYEVFLITWPHTAAVQHRKGQELWGCLEAIVKLVQTSGWSLNFITPPGTLKLCFHSSPSPICSMYVEL